MSKRIEVPNAYWPTDLTNAIFDAESGDVIIVETLRQVSLGISTASLLFPDKCLAFESRTTHNTVDASTLDE